MIYQPHRTKGNNCGIGGKRDPDAPRKPLQSHKRLNPVSVKRAQANPVYRAVKAALLDILAKRYGRPDGTGNRILVPCAMNPENWVPLDEIQPDHILGRVGHEPGKLDPFWAPSNIQWLSSQAHALKTNPPDGFGPDHVDYAAINLLEYRVDSLQLEVAILTYLRTHYPLAGQMLWTDEMEAEAIMKTLGKAVE